MEKLPITEKVVRRRTKAELGKLYKKDIVRNKRDVLRWLGDNGEKKKEDDGDDGEEYMTTSRLVQEAHALADRLELEEWDPTSLPENFFLVLEGKRRTGKSTFAKWLLQWYKDRFSMVWCLTNTKASGYWQKFVGDQFTFDGWYSGPVKKLMDRNDKIIKEYGEESKEARMAGSALLILDDVIASNQIHNDEIFQTLAVEGRHHLMSVILMTQDPKAISPKVRDNADVAVVFNQKTFRNKESIWHDFMNDVDRRLAFALLEKFSVEHNALVCIQTNLNGKIKRNFFKTTGDKTQLWDPKYCLGGAKQKELIMEERFQKKQAKRIKRESKTGKKVIMRQNDLTATDYTVKNILS